MLMFMRIIIKVIIFIEDFFSFYFSYLHLVTKPLEWYFLIQCLKVFIVLIFILILFVSILIPTLFFFISRALIHLIL